MKRLLGTATVVVLAVCLVHAIDKAEPKPEMFAPGIISTHLEESGGS
jgi:hypothetical protein